MIHTGGQLQQYVVAVLRRDGGLDDRRMNETRSSKLNFNDCRKRLWVLTVLVVALLISATANAGGNPADVRMTTHFSPPLTFGVAADGRIFAGDPFIGREVVEVRITWDVVVADGHDAADIFADVFLPINTNSGNSVIILDGATLGWSGSGTFNHYEATDRYNGFFGQAGTGFGHQSWGLPFDAVDILPTSRIEIDYVVPETVKYGGGGGISEDPYQIWDANHMQAIGADANDWDKHFVLMADIDVSQFDGKDGREEFNVIGNGDNPFTGVFDGNGHKIWNFTYDSNDTYNIGLFGCLNDQDAEVKNLSLIDASIDVATAGTVGVLVARLTEGSVSGCHVVGGTVTGGSGVGGLVGHIQWGRVTECSSTAAITGYSTVGGLAGKNYGGSIMNSCSTGSVTGEFSVGGLVGSNMGFAYIINCYATGDVTGNRNLAGIAGHNSCREGRLGTIQCCYSVGGVTGTEYVGSIVGWNCGAVVSSFWDIQTSGMDEPDRGEGRTTAQMQDPDTFRAFGWDFVGPADGLVDIWAEPPGGGYPILWWQLSPQPDVPFSGGTGQPDDPYLISTPDELNSISHNPSLMTAHFKLMNDIDLFGVNFFIIGSELFPFAGVFDGNGQKVLNFSLTCQDARNVGLFGYVDDPYAQIRDLGLIGTSISAQGGWNVGSLIGYLKDGTIDGCYVQDVNISGEYDVGGLVGETWGAVTNCRSTGSVSGDDNVGGLVGSNRGGGSVTECFSAGSVLGEERVGGLDGLNLYGDIAFCYSTSSVHGDRDVGGLIGDNRDTVIECYSTGFVSGEEDVGGLVGVSSTGSVERSFWDIQTSGQSGSIVGVGKTTAKMMQQSTFENWDFINVWGIGENQTYPYLRKYSAADVNEDESVDFADLAILADNWLGHIAP